MERHLRIINKNRYKIKGKGLLYKKRKYCVADMIETKNLIKSFDGINVLEGINFSLSKGELITLLGPNGSGKTTLMRIICGYISPDKGQVFIDGEEFSRNRINILSKIGYMPENIPLYQELTVAEYLYFIGRIYGMKKQMLEKSFLKMTSDLELDKVLNQKIQTLSKGYRRRVGIASVLIHHPEYVILDEPTEGLDPHQKITVRRLLKEYAQNHMVLISTHLLEEVEALNGRIVVLSGGKLCYDGNIDGMRAQSSDNTLTGAFLKMTETSLTIKE